MSVYPNISVKADTLKFTLPSANVLINPRLKTGKADITSDGEVITYYHTVKKHLPKGINQIYAGSKNANIQLSSALMGGELYTYQNLDKAISNINKTGIIKIIANDFIDKAIFKRFDTTQDIEVKNVEATLKAIKYLQVNPKYRFQGYKGNNNLTIYPEVESKPKAKFYAKFGKIRFELTLNSMKLIRKQFDIDITDTYNLFLNEKDILLTYFDDMMNTNSQMIGKVNELDFIQTKGFEALFNNCNGDSNKVDQLLKQAYPNRSTLSRKRSKFKEWITLTNKDSKELELIREFRESLANSYIN